MTTQQKDIIKNNWQKVSTIDDAVVGSLFYNKLFGVNCALAAAESTSATNK